jgi:hypothetical protein
MAAPATPKRITLKLDVRAGGYGEVIGNAHSRL